MPRYLAPHDVLVELQQNCKVVRKPKYTILFKRGEAAFGMFLVMRGKVTLDFGVDGSCSLNGAYGPGALVGLPAALTGRTYSMTATVTNDAELGFISSKDLKGILLQQPALCRQLLDILNAKIMHTYQTTKGHLDPSEIGMA